MNNTTFKPSELLVDYNEWIDLVNSRKNTLSEETKEWLSAWEHYYSHLENVPDEWIRCLRSGHFVGYYQAKQKGN